MGKGTEIELDELIETLNDNVKEDIKVFDDIVNLDGYLRRELYILGTVDGSGPTINGYIRFWNAYDNDKNIPYEDREPIKIYIDTYGGSTIDALMIMDSIRMSETPVWTIALGKVWSSGFEIFYMGNHRISYPNASFLWHEGSIALNQVDTNKFRNYAAYYEKELERFKKMLFEHSSITEEFFEEHKKDDVWLTAEEAVDLGVVDEIAKGFI